MKFIHAADLHLDSQFIGLSRYPGAPEDEVRGATRRALENLVKLAIDEGASFVLIAGDIYDGDWKDYNTGLFFNHQMSRLGDEGIGVYLIKGNHDAKSQISRNLILPKNVHEFPTNRPETMRIDDLRVAIHGRGFATQAVTDDIAAQYPEAISGYFNIGLLHTSATGREGHENYAPCSLETLISKGYDYWALGHIHQREILYESPYIVFSGNTQGRHIRETGEKGCMLVTVADGEVAEIKHRRLDVLQWIACEIDVAGADTREDVLEGVRSGLLQKIADIDESRLIAVRITIRGECEAHSELAKHESEFAADVRASLTDFGGGRLWLEKLIIKTKTPINLQEIAARDDALGQLVQFVRGASEDEPLLKELLADFQTLRSRLPSEISHSQDGIDLDSTESIVRRLPDIENDLISYLLDREAAL